MAELWISASKSTASRHNLGYDNVSTKDMAIKTGLKQFTLSDRVYLRSASNTSGLPSKNVSKLA